MFKNFLNWLYFWKKKPRVVIDEPINDVQPTPPPINNVQDFELKKGMRGIDISHWNEVEDWNELRDNVEFVYMKATEGDSFLSRTYEQRAKILNDLGFTWGAYHYYRTSKDPIEQVEHFMKYYDPTNKLPPVLDVEAINNNFKYNVHTKEVLTMLEELERRTGRIPILYTNFYFARDIMRTTVEFKKYPLWLAWYTPDFKKVKVPPPWNNVKMWQYTDKGIVPGMKKGVDRNKVMS